MTNIELKAMTAAFIGKVRSTKVPFDLPKLDTFDALISAMDAFNVHLEEYERKLTRERTMFEDRMAELCKQFGRIQYGRERIGCDDPVAAGFVGDDLYHEDPVDVRFVDIQDSTAITLVRMSDFTRFDAKTVRKPTLHEFQGVDYGAVTLADRGDEFLGDIGDVFDFVPVDLRYGVGCKEFRVRGRGGMFRLCDTCVEENSVKATRPFVTNKYKNCFIRGFGRPVKLCDGCRHRNAGHV